MTKYVLVPVEATEEMGEAGHDRLGGDGQLTDLYAAMLSARPAVPASEVEGAVRGRGFDLG